MSNLIFDWKPYRGEWLYPAIFLFLSLFAHLFAFYVFHVTYPPATTIMPAPAQVEMLNPANPEHARLLARLEADDPALLARIQVPPGSPENLQLPYPPSFHAATPAPPVSIRRNPPELAEPEVSFQTFLRSGMTREVPPTILPDPPPSSTPHHFEVKPSGESLIARLPPESRLEISEPGLLPPGQPPLFLVGVAPSGETRHVFLMQSSGDRAQDQHATALIREFAFEPDPGTHQMVWDHISLVPIAVGVDAARPLPNDSRP